MPNKTRLVESATLNSPVRQSPFHLDSSQLILAARFRRAGRVAAKLHRPAQVTHMIRRTSSTPASSSPSRLSLLPSPKLASRSKFDELMPAPAWSWNE